MGDHVVSAWVNSTRAETSPTLPTKLSVSKVIDGLKTLSVNQPVYLQASQSGDCGVADNVTSTCGSVVQPPREQVTNHCVSTSQPVSQSVSRHLLVFAIRKNFLLLSSPPTTPGHAHTHACRHLQKGRHTHKDTSQPNGYSCHTLLLKQAAVLPHRFNRCFSFK